MSTVSTWDGSIDTVIRQVLRDVKRNNSQAMKGTMHTVSPHLQFATFTFLPLNVLANTLSRSVIIRHGGNCPFSLLISIIGHLGIVFLG